MAIVEIELSQRLVTKIQINTKWGIKIADRRCDFALGYHLFVRDIVFD